MINEEIEVTYKEKKEYPPIPKDIYPVEIFDINVKDAKGQYAQQGEKVFAFQFTILDGMDKDKSLRGRNVWDNFVPTYLYIGKSGKNKLYRIIESVLNREISPEEVATFDKAFLNKLIGEQLRVMIEPKKVGDKTFDNITDYLVLNTKLNPLTNEEREKYKVKEKEEKIEELPTINLEDEEIRLEDIPY